MGGADVQFHSFLTSAIDGGKRPASRQEAGWARACLRVVDKRQISCRCRDFELHTVQLTASSQHRLRYSDSEMINVVFKKYGKKGDETGYVALQTGEMRQEWKRRT